ncbi:MAG: hypothetical protein JWM44_1596 [Bacilli bacterium]|nr:hypothetical protein [Bacilli bacterium]
MQHYFLVKARMFFHVRLKRLERELRYSARLKPVFLLAFYRLQTAPKFFKEMYYTYVDD